MLVAVAGNIADSPLSDAPDAKAHLVLSDGPGSFPLLLESSFSDGRAVFLTQAPQKRYVASLEVVSEGVFGRHRVMVEPVALEGPAVSDLLLFRPVGQEEPTTPLEAASMMLGTEVVGAGDPAGVYSEVYGSPEGGAVSLEVEVEREGGGLIDWVSRLIPGGAEEGRGRISWTEPSPGPEFGKGVVLDLGELEAGQYVLKVRAQWQGQESLVAERGFEVRG